MKLYLSGIALAASLLAACSLPASLDRNDERYHEHMHEQTMRLMMHEQYLARLTEFQLELDSTLERIDQRTRNMEAQLSRYTRQAEKQKSVDEPDARTKGPEVVATATPMDKLVVGRNEWIWLDLLQRNLKARIDTGALSSSLNATDVQAFERDGNDWIRFRVPDEDHADGGDLYEAPLVRHVKIRQASAEELERRPVVLLQVRMGEHVEDTEFNLTNRENMLYPLLLGRNFLRDVMVVDVAKKFTQDKYLPDQPVADAE